MIRNPYKENAFAILRLPTWTSVEKITERENELIQLAEIGEYDRNRDEIEQAVRRLIDPNERIKEELFSFIPLDNELEENIPNGNIDIDTNGDRFKCVNDLEGNEVIFEI